jgi:hypothetical protein
VHPGLTAISFKLTVLVEVIIDIIYNKTKALISADTKIKWLTRCDFKMMLSKKAEVL